MRMYLIRYVRSSNHELIGLRDRKDFAVQLGGTTLMRNALSILSSSVDIRAIPRMASLSPFSESSILISKLLNFSISIYKKLV